MDESLKSRINNQIFKLEATLEKIQEQDSCFTLDYENGRYREDELVGIIRDAATFFALTESELSTFDTSEHTRRSFTRISDANQDKKGDYGELLLYIILEIFYKVPKFVTKARLRSTTREQIKGFDCAHFSIDDDNKVILWLGEAKFYSDFSRAISAVATSLKDHLNDLDYIKRELKILGGEIEINKTLNPEKFDLLKNYVDGGRSMDTISINVPVLITYDSVSIIEYCNKSININDPDFQKALVSELNSKFESIYSKTWPKNQSIKIIFFIMPFKSVSEIKAKINSVEEAMKF